MSYSRNLFKKKNISEGRKWFGYSILLGTDGVKAKYIAGEKHSETKWTHYPHYAVIAMDVVIIAVNILVWVEIKQTLPPRDNLVRVI